MELLLLNGGKEIAYWVGVWGTVCLVSLWEDPWPFPERAHGQGPGSLLLAGEENLCSLRKDSI